MAGGKRVLDKVPHTKIARILIRETNEISEQAFQKRATEGYKDIFLQKTNRKRNIEVVPAHIDKVGHQMQFWRSNR